nr:tRNA dihydrouridine(20/20a) synthase DusA [Hahella ganghwensis]
MSNSAILPVTRRFSIAPMMDWTDRHYRYLARLISRHALLYSEMITTGAILFGDQSRFLDFNNEEHPIAVQLGGSNPVELAKCAHLCEQWGYDEINLNVGCPSDRVQNNMIGACLMAEKDLVSECLKAMRDSVDIPVTVKHRIGIDHLDSEDFLIDFVDTLQRAGTTTFIIHARKAILKGLSPKENREIPPLIYDRVYKIKQLFPNLEIIINGGIKTLEEVKEHLKYVDGVMVGREAYQRPWVLADIDHHLYNGPALEDSALEIGYQYLSYIEKQHANGLPIWHMVRHSLGLFHGQKGGKVFRRHLSQNAVKKDASPAVFEEALKIMSSFSNKEV